MNKTSKSVFALSALTLCSVLAGCGTTGVSELRVGDIDLATANAATVTLKEDSKTISWAEPKATTAKINFYGYTLPTYNDKGTKLETVPVLYLRKGDSSKEAESEHVGYFTVDTSAETFKYYNDEIYSKFTINLGKLVEVSKAISSNFNYFECEIDLCKGNDAAVVIASLSEPIKFAA